MVVVENPEACTSCLICELVCSFHHTRRFSRTRSSIKVNKSIFNSEKGAKIAINYGGDHQKPICNNCKGEHLPLCVSFCPENVLRATEGD